MPWYNSTGGLNGTGPLYLDNGPTSGNDYYAPVNLAGVPVTDGNDAPASGGSGNDTIVGGGGADTLTGGDGNDVLIGGGSSGLSADLAVLGIQLNANVDLSGLLNPDGNDSLLGGNGNDTLLGQEGNDTLVGGAGNDVLFGGTGADSMSGGVGDDIYYVDNVNDRVVSEVAGTGGTDLINTTLATFTLGEAGQNAANVENLTYIGTGNFTGTGNSLDNVITGGAGNDTINGGAGNDTIIGGGGNDALTGGGGIDTVQFANAFASYSFTVNELTGDAVVNGTDGSTTTTAGFSNFAFSDQTVAFAALPCYATGTRIETTRGLVTVEDLRAGDVVRTVSGRHGDWAPVKWIGFRQVDLLRHPNPAKVQPVRIRASALCDATPVRDLVVSPDHCMWIDGALVPAHFLINGHTVVQETARATVTYWHVELEQHDVLVAEGAAAESYLDTGNRHAFSNGGASEMLHADFEGSDSAERLVPRLPADGGDVVRSVRAKLADQFQIAA